LRFFAAGMASFVPERSILHSCGTGRGTSDALSSQFSQLLKEQEQSQAHE